MIQENFNSIIDLVKTFPNEQACIDHLEKIRWSGNIVSPFDPKSKVYKCKNNRYKCKNTNKYFNVKTNTLFQNTKTDLQTWFIAIWLITGHKKGISSLQLAKFLNVTQKTAWFMLHRIRSCFNINNNIKLEGEVEIDETYIGGKNKNKHKNKKIQGSQGRSLKGKSVVVGMIQRDGLLIARRCKNANKKTLTSLATKNIKEKTIIYTDEWKGYNGLDSLFNHGVINHKKHEYVNGDVHINTIEGFWSLLKRGLSGTYHSVSKKHLQAYIDEFVYRYNTRSLTSLNRFNDFIVLICENYMTYKELINTPLSA